MKKSGEDRSTSTQLTGTRQNKKNSFAWQLFKNKIIYKFSKVNTGAVKDDHFLLIYNKIAQEYIIRFCVTKIIFGLLEVSNTHHKLMKSYMLIINTTKKEK